MTLFGFLCNDKMWGIARVLKLMDAFQDSSLSRHLFKKSGAGKGGALT